jgi:sulfite exporter TauE/SafE
VTALAISAFVAALLGSGHCAAMCGAFACASADVAPGAMARLRASAGYHVARLVAYATLGVIAGAAGARLDTMTLRAGIRPAALVAGGLLVLWGAARLAALAGARLPHFPAPRFAQHAVSAVLRRFSAASPRARAVALGLVAPLLPCGWLYAFVASAASTGSPWEGAAVMAGFWLGTVPALAAVSIGLHQLLGPARRMIPAATAVAMILVGTMTMVRAADGAPVAHHHTAAP